jgi:predicted MPP superfamily phosphohydrolase
VIIRRLLLAIVLCGLAVGAIALVARRDTFSPVLREVVVPVPGLRHEIRLLQVSDLQGNRFGARQGALATLLDGSGLDAVVLTGDMLDFERQRREPVYELLEVVKARTPRVYYLQGNHDPPGLGPDLAARGATALRSGVPIAFAPDDPSGRDVALIYGVDRRSILGAKGRGSKLLVVAAHTPPNAGRLAAGASLPGGVHLYIAGHTHGGQIRLPLLGAIAAPMSWYGEEGGNPRDNEITLWPDMKGRLVDGMYELAGQKVFVTRGVGTTGYGAGEFSMRIRFLCRAEIVLFRFVPKATCSG